MLSCMDLYGLLETPGLIPGGSQLGVLESVMGYWINDDLFFRVQESMSYFGGRDRSNKVLVDIFGKHLRGTSLH